MYRALVIFGRLQDMRQKKKVRHKLLDIVIITIIAVMGACTDWEEVSEFGRAREGVLRKYLELRNGIPSHDTFRRVLGLIKPEALEECYRQWVGEVLEKEELEQREDIISIDGKTIRGSGKPGLKPIHMISAWSASAGITLAQLKTSEKSNEITAIRELLKVLDIEGCTVTTDAAGCQIKNAEQIMEQKGEYVIACKENQKGLYEEITEYFELVDESEAKAQSEAEENGKAKKNSKTKEEDLAAMGYSKKIHSEKRRGRFEKRIYELIQRCELLSRLHDFQGAKSIGRATTQVTLPNGKVRSEARYYVTSLSGEEAIQRFAKSVRSHWGIENSCHWVVLQAFPAAVHPCDLVESSAISSRTYDFERPFRPVPFAEPHPWHFALTVRRENDL
jgi:predicted transposase YbfD/YdcC